MDTTQTAKELHLELRNILSGASPAPDAVISRLHALELRRLHALEQAKLLAADPKLSKDEDKFLNEVIVKLQHAEQARNFHALDIYWRCLAVEQSIARKDAAGASDSLKHFDAKEDALLFKAHSAQRNRLALFQRHEAKRTRLLEETQPMEWLQRHTAALRPLSGAYVNLVASHVTAVEDYVILRAAEAEQPSQDSVASLPTPQPSSPRVDEMQSPRRGESQASMPRSTSRSPSQARKRSADAMDQDPAERRASSPVARLQDHDTMDLDVYEEEKDELGAWIHADDSMERERNSPSAMKAVSAEVEVPSIAAPPAVPLSQAPAIRPSASPEHDYDQFAATQPPQKLVHPPLLSKLGMAAKLNAEKLRAKETSKRQAEKAKKAAAKRTSAEAAASAAPPSRALGPSNLTILMPPPPAASSTLPPAQPQPQPKIQPQAPVPSASESSQATGSGDDSGEASTSQELPPAAQPAQPPHAPTYSRPPSAPSAPARVLVPASQSSNESQESNQPFTQAVARYDSTDESQEKQESQLRGQPARNPTSSLEDETDAEAEGDQRLSAVSEKSEEQVQAGKSFGQLEGEATSGPEDEEAMTAVHLALAENGSSSHSLQSLK